MISRATSVHVGLAIGIEDIVAAAEAEVHGSATPKPRSVGGVSRWAILGSNQ
jgi:hypothetical protein